MFRIKDVLSFLLLVVLVPCLLYAELSEVEIEILKAETKVVPVKFVVDPYSGFQFVHRPMKRYIRQLMAQISRECRPVGIQLEFAGIELIKINRDPTLSGIEADLLYVVENIKPPENGIVILVSSRDYGISYHRGLAVLRGRHFLIADGMKAREEGEILNHPYYSANLKSQIKQFELKIMGILGTHELFHLLGIPHSNNRHSIMAEEISISSKLDSEDIEMVLTKKVNAFKLTPSTVILIGDSYSENTNNQQDENIESPF